VSLARSCLVLALAFVGVLILAACGEESAPAPGPDTTSTAQSSPGAGLTATMTPPPLSGLTGHCNPPVMDTTPFQLEVKAEWHGKDRIVIEGSVLLAEAASLQYVICQDGEVSFSLVPAHRPEVRGGEITAESKLVPSERGPAFDPDAEFEAVLFFLRKELQIPMLIGKVPVEGQPE